MERRKFTREFKLEAARLIKDRGVSYVQASQDLGVHPSQLLCPREWAPWPLERPRWRSGAASIVRFARTRRRSSTYRGISTIKNSPFASEKFTGAIPGSSLEIRVSAAFASGRHRKVGTASIAHASDAHDARIARFSLSASDQDP